MMLHPVTDEVRKSMLETICHTIVALFVIVSATILAIHADLDSAAWAGACGTAIAASGAVTVIRRSEVDRGNADTLDTSTAQAVMENRAMLARLEAEHAAERAAKPEGSD